MEISFDPLGQDCWCWSLAQLWECLEKHQSGRGFIHLCVPLISISLSRLYIQHEIFDSHSWFRLTPPPPSPLPQCIILFTKGFPYSGKVSHRQYRQEDYISHAEILHESSLNLFLRSGSMGRLGIGGEVKGGSVTVTLVPPRPSVPFIFFSLLSSLKNVFKPNKCIYCITCNTLSGKYSTWHV